MTSSTTETTATATTYPIHFLGCVTIVTSSSILGQGLVTEYGTEVTVTPEFRANNTDRLGGSWLDLVDDEPAQVRRWGKVMFRLGPWPEGWPRVEPGSLRWHDDAAAARVEASKITDPGLRHERQNQINGEYGPRPTTSTTLAQYGRRPGDPAPEASR